jgi:hypothetical protein
MARKYAKMWLAAWSPGSDFYALGPDAQWLYWVLVGHPKLTPAGVAALQPRQWAKRAKGMTVKRVTAAYDELVRRSYLLADDDTEEVLIRTFIRWDKGYRTPNIRKSIEVSIERIESDRLRHTATHELTLAVTHEGTDGPDDGGTHGESQAEGFPEPIGHRTTEPQNGRTEEPSSSSPESTVIAFPERDDDDFVQVVSIVLEGREREYATTIRNARAWRATVRKQIVAEDGELIRKMLVDGSGPELVAAFVLGYGETSHHARDYAPIAWCDASCPVCDGDNFVYPDDPTVAHPCPNRVERKEINR